MNLLLNFRDFGAGMRSSDGRRVREGLLFRSAHLSGLSEDATTELLARNFVAVIDLRYVDERKKHRSPWPDTMFDRVVAHDGTTECDAPHLAIMREAVNGEAAIDDAYLAFYESLPFDRWYGPLFARAAEAAAAAPGPILVHCTAGKDRTGSFAALMLSALNVDDADIVTDYMRTNGAPGMERLRSEVEERFPQDDGTPTPQALVDALLAVKPEYIRTFVGIIREKYGSIDVYLRAFGAQDDIVERLRSRYLTD